MTVFELSQPGVGHKPGIGLIAGAVVFFGISGALWAFFLGEMLILKGIAIAAAALMGALIFMEPLVGLCLMAFLVPLEEVRPFFGGWLTPTKAVGVVTFVSFLVYAHLRREMARFDKQSRWMFAFAAWAALSFLWAREKSSVLFLVLTITQLVLFWVLMRASLRSEREILAVSISFIAGTVAGIFTAAILPRWELAPRLMYTTGNPNHLARDIVVGLVLLVYYIPGLRSWSLPAALTAGAILLLGLVLTESRAGWLGAVLCVPLVLLGQRKASSLGLLTGMAFIAVVMFAMGLLSAHLGVTTAALENRWESMFRTRVMRASRLDIWRAGIILASRYPVLGVGAGGFLESVPEVTETMPDYLGAESALCAHNSFIGVFAELGVVGFTLFAGALWHCGRTIAKRPRSSAKMLAWALFGSAVIQMIFMTAHYQKTIWFSLALSQIVVPKEMPDDEVAMASGGAEFESSSGQ